MSKPKHTPGPWVFTFEDHEGFPCCYLDEAKTKVPTLTDLNLIDASPNMLEALEFVEKISIDWDLGDPWNLDVYDTVTKAIAKAKGK